MGGKKTPTLPETPAPTTMPLPSQVNPAQTEQQRQLKLTNLQRGILSTIKTSPSGVSGAGTDLSGTGGKKTLGGS